MIWRLRIAEMLMLVSRAKPKITVFWWLESRGWRLRKVSAVLHLEEYQSSKLIEKQVLFAIAHSPNLNLNFTLSSSSFSSCFLPFNCRRLKWKCVSKCRSRELILRLARSLVPDVRYQHLRIGRPSSRIDVWQVSTNSCSLCSIPLLL